jgi:hypothetical protein
MYPRHLEAARLKIISGSCLWNWRVIPFCCNRLLIKPNICRLGKGTFFREMILQLTREKLKLCNILDTDIISVPRSSSKRVWFSILIVKRVMRAVITVQSVGGLCKSVVNWSRSKVIETNPFPVGSVAGIEHPSLALSSFAKRSSRLRSVWNCTTNKEGIKRPS